MTKQLLIYLDNQQPEKPSVISTHESGTIENTLLHCDFAELKQFSTGYNVTVVIPGGDVLLTETHLPKMNRQRLIRAIPFALEEKLIDDVENLHFALGDETDAPQSVAVIAKQKLERILASLKEVGILPTKMLPATLTLPLLPDKTTLCVVDQQCIFRTGSLQGFVCDKADLALYLEMHPQADIEEMHLTQEQFLEKMHDWLLMQSTFNLLQGPYQPKQKKSFTKKIWQAAAVLAVAWVCLIFLNNIVSLIILQKSAHKNELAIQAIYKKHFPEATSIVAPRERMEAKLKKMMGESNKNDLLNVLGVIGISLNKTPDISLKSLDFKDNRFNLTVLSSSYASLDEFSQSLTTQGVNVKRQSADMAGTQMKANLIIKRGA